MRLIDNNTYHVPVLLKESVDGLSIHPGGVYVDVTFGASTYTPPGCMDRPSTLSLRSTGTWYVLLSINRMCTYLNKNSGSKVHKNPHICLLFLAKFIKLNKMRSLFVLRQ